MTSNRLQTAPLGWLLLCAVLLTVMGAGCGRKAPPIPPQSEPLPLINSLNGRISGDDVFLSWRSAKSAREIKKYVILRSQVDPDKPPCAGCPRVFQRVGEVGADPLVRNLQYSEPTAPGFIYTYKVQPVGTSGNAGPESSPVTIDRTTR